MKISVSVEVQVGNNRSIKTASFDSAEEMLAQDIENPLDQIPHIVNRLMLGFREPKPEKAPRK